MNTVLIAAAGAAFLLYRRKGASDSSPDTGVLVNAGSAGDSEGPGGKHPDGTPIEQVPTNPATPPAAEPAPVVAAPVIANTGIAGVIGARPGPVIANPGIAGVIGARPGPALSGAIKRSQQSPPFVPPYLRAQSCFAAGTGCSVAKFESGLRRASKGGSRRRSVL